MGLVEFQEGEPEYVSGSPRRNAYGRIYIARFSPPVSFPCSISHSPPLALAVLLPVTALLPFAALLALVALIMATIDDLLHFANPRLDTTREEGRGEHNTENDE